MDTTTQAHPERSQRSNRNAPVEQWPESVAILRHLASHILPRSIRDIATAVAAPEISTRNRLIRLEAAGTISVHRGQVATPSGKPAVGMHYRITQFGRDCAGAPVCTPTEGTSSHWGRATSVFAWGR
jgi:hypothetical protein